MDEPWWIVRNDFVTFVSRWGRDVVAALVIAAIGWMIASWVSRGIVRLSHRSARFDATLVPVLARSASVAVLAITLVAVLSKFGVDTSSALAFLGAAGLAIGLALKDTLADVASGIALLVLRPFDAGDTIDVDGTTGTVDAIELFTTRLTSLEGVPIVLPNAKVRASKIQNFTRAKTRRFDLIVGIGYGDDIGRAMGALRDVVASDPRVLHDPPPLVQVNDLGDSSVNVLIRAWTLPAVLLDTKLDLTRAVKERLDAEGVSIPFPQRDVHVFPVSGGQAA